MTRWLLPLFLLAALLFRLPGALPTTHGKNEQRAKAVAKNLRAHAPPATGVGWNEFQLRVAERIGDGEYAIAAGWEHWADGQQTPYVTITAGYLRVFGGDPDALAVLIGRELGTLALGQVPRRPGEARLGQTGASRRCEADTDLFAAKLLLRSGYSLRNAVAGLRRHLDELPVGARPALAERIAHLTRLLEGEELWRLMPAFDAGLTFRAIQQYPPAEACFARVLAEFPRARDAWALLTVSRLMRYRALVVRADAPRTRPVVTLANGMTVAPGDDYDETLTKLARPTRTTPACPGSSLDSLWFEAHGVQVYADGDAVLAVVLTAKGPRYDPPGGGKPAGALKVGMTRTAAELLLGTDYDLRPFLPSRSGVCAYYPARAVAVVYDRDGPDGVVTSVIVGPARQ